MFNVCFQCGQYTADKIIDNEKAPEGWAVARCPQCGHEHPFRYLPLLLITGASGTGKTTISYSLSTRIRGLIVLDNDILWQPEFTSNGDSNRRFFETWLRVCKNIHQSGQQVVLFGTGTGIPENLEACTEIRYFPQVHRLAYVCDDESLELRLRARPRWRGASSDDFINAQMKLNRWFLRTGAPPDPSIDLINTSTYNLAQTLKLTAEWIQRHKVSASALREWQKE